MMKKSCLLLLLFLSALQSFAEMPYADWWQKANLFYQRKEYDSAAGYYEKIASLHPDNATVYYNLGNTYYRLNKIGPSVLNYQRALKINPSYTEAKDNLELTQSRIPNRIQQSPDIFFVTWWKNISKSSAAGLWATVSLMLFLVLLFTILMRWWGKAPSWLLPQVIILLLIVCICSIYISYISASRKARLFIAMAFSGSRSMAA